MKTSLTDSFPLERYGHDLTHVAQQGIFPPLVGYEKCMTRVFGILLRKEKMNSKYNPLLLDVDGIQRWRVLSEVVRRMAVGEAPDPLPTQQVIGLNVEALLVDRLDATPTPASGIVTGVVPGERPWDAALAESASKDRGEVVFAGEEWPSLEKWSAPPDVMRSRFRAFFLAVRQFEGQVVVFVNDFHRLVGGEWQRYPVDEAPLLKPLLARREIQLIGACTPAQYHQSIERDAAIARRMQEFDVRSDEELRGM